MMTKRFLTGCVFFSFCLIWALLILFFGCKRSAETETPQLDPAVIQNTIEVSADMPEDPNSAIQGAQGSIESNDQGAQGFSPESGAGSQNPRPQSSVASERPAGNARSGESLSSGSLSGIRSGRGVSIGELNPVNYKTVDPAILLQMGMEQYQVSFIMGELYLNAKNYDRALTEYNKAISLKPDYVEAFFSRGRTYQIKGELNRAMDDYTKTINLKKDSAAAYNYRGYIFAQR